MNSVDAVYFVDFIFCNKFEFPSGFSSRLEWPISRQKALKVLVHGSRPKKSDKLVSLLELLIFYLNNDDFKSALPDEDGREAFEIVQEKFELLLDDPYIRLQLMNLQKLMSKETYNF